MKIAYYPGCSLAGTAKEYAESIEAVCKKFEIELVEINDWNCCGATAAHSLNHTLSVALPARSLALAEEQGFDEILVPCAACYSRLMSAFDAVKDQKEKDKISEIIEMPIQGSAKPINILEFIAKYIEPKLAENVKQKLGAEMACYYGCLLVRPQKLVNTERFEDPLVMENTLKKLGAKGIDWGYKTECCGAGMSVPKTDIVAKLAGKIYDDAASRDAKAIVMACPMCHSNLDMRRPEIEKYLNKEAKMPAMYITQVIGLALGISPEELGFSKHFVEVNYKSLYAVDKPKEKKKAAVKKTKVEA